MCLCEKNGFSHTVAAFIAISFWAVAMLSPSVVLAQFRADAPHLYQVPVFEPSTNLEGVAQTGKPPRNPQIMRRQLVWGTLGTAATFLVGGYLTVEVSGNNLDNFGEFYGDMMTGVLLTSAATITASALITHHIGKTETVKGRFLPTLVRGGVMYVATGFLSGLVSDNASDAVYTSVVLTAISLGTTLGAVTGYNQHRHYRPSYAEAFRHPHEVGIARAPKVNLLSIPFSTR